MRIEGAGGARDVHHAKQFAIAGIVNRNGSAGPPLHLQVNRNAPAPRNWTGFDSAIAAPIALVPISASAPASSVFEMNRAAGVDDPVVALGIDDQPAGIGEIMIEFASRRNVLNSRERSGQRDGAKRAWRAG